MVEEQVIQPESVTPAEQPVAETPAPQAPNLDSVKAEYESKISALESKVADPTTDPFPEDANSDPKDMVKKLTEKFDAKNTELEEALPF